ncbi:serine protease [Gemmata sp. JC717]|uniref:trypsin-like peptidase domain-containing protein n=1 Tax=Gemmata algarum TaxID=2975278 RepID=UPI0021BA71BA|nr:serine protease [Gemmata algarum]MDY3555417.1 serine protease [Gemmata algarum]
MWLTLLVAASLAEPSLSSCAWVRAENDSAGTGFVVGTDKRLLVTCRHVVADRKNVDVFFPWVRDGSLVTDRAEYLRNRSKLRELGLLATGTVLKTSDEFDLALLALDSLPRGTRAVTFATEVPPPGTELCVIGNRLDLDTVWNVTRGPLRTSGQLRDGYFWRGKKLALNANALIAQFPTEEGDSGGPVFNPRGEVVGANCALRRACPLASVLISATDIRAFLHSPAEPAKPARPVPAADALTRATVWVKPTATDVHLAGVLIEPDVVLTAARGLTAGGCVGVALPIREGDHWVSERDAYADPLGLHLQGVWRSGTVLARDTGRDLALVQLDSPSHALKPLPLAEHVPAAGDALHALSHPNGLEFAWVYSSGSVRQRGNVALDLGERAPRVEVLVCQLPAQAGSPGGPVTNAAGELVGILSSRDGAQQVGYAVTADEIRAFLDESRRNTPPTSLAGLLTRLEAVPRTQRVVWARALARQADAHRAAGRLTDAQRQCEGAISLDAGCPDARLCRSRMLAAAPALAELDAAVEAGPFHRDVLLRRSALAREVKDFRKARGDAACVLDAFPADTDAREALALAYLGLGDDAKAATALGESVRADPARMKSVAGIILAHAAVLEQKFPDTPGTAANWLASALTGVQKGTRSPHRRTAIADALKAAGAAKDDATRLAQLRAWVHKER